MVGDGATDLQAKAPGVAADAFIGFGGVAVRPVVEEGADWFVTDFGEMTAVVLNGAAERGGR
jgi:phosphoserine phosphatase